MFQVSSCSPASLVLPTGVNETEPCRSAAVSRSQVERADDGCVEPAPEVSEIAPWIAACQPRLAHRMSNGWTVADNRQANAEPLFEQRTRQSAQVHHATPEEYGTRRIHHSRGSDGSRRCQTTWSSDLPKPGSPCEAAKGRPPRPRALLRVQRASLRQCISILFGRGVHLRTTTKVCDRSPVPIRRPGRCLGRPHLVPMPVPI